VIDKQCMQKIMPYRPAVLLLKATRLVQY